MRAPNDCAALTSSAPNGDTTKVRHGQANNSIRCTRYEQPAWDAIGGCRRSKDAALENEPGIYASMIWLKPSEPGATHEQ